jgi:hypothetical protein
VDPRSDELARRDETLDDVEGGDALPGGALRADLLGQRLVHGLLAATATARDEVGRQRRLDAILAAVRSTPDADEVLDALDQVDETLADLDGDIDGDIDGDLAGLGAVEGPAVRAELARQRVVDALLRVTREPDAARRRGERVRRIVDALPVGDAAGGAGGGGGRILRLPRRWERYAVAAVLFVAVGLALRALLGGGLDPHLEAATRELGRAADHHFGLTVDRIDGPAIERIGVHDLWLRPLPDGRLRFRLHLDGARSGQQQIGCDGDVIWRQNLADAADREALPIASANAMFERLAARSARHLGIRDPDQFDVRQLLGLLAGQQAEHSARDATIRDDGHASRTYFFDGLEHPAYGRLAAVMVRVDLSDHRIEALEFVRQAPDGVMRFRFEHRGVEPQPASFYDQPW